MSTVKTTNLQHPSAPSPNLVLNADGSVTGGGVIIAVKHALFTGTQTNSTAGGADFAVTDLSITHTLSSASNKLIISAYLGVAASSLQRSGVGISVADDGTLIVIGDAASTRNRVGAGGLEAGSAAFAVASPSLTFVYEPGDTNSHTYTVRAINAEGGTQTVYINRTSNNSDQGPYVRGTSGFVIQEVKV